MKHKVFLILTFALSLTSCSEKRNRKEIKQVQNEIREIKKDFWDNGKLASEGIYINNIANGNMKWYHENGYLAGEGEMVNDKRNGLWKVYNKENGKLSAEGNFTDDNKNGDWKLYNDKGTLCKIQFWKNNKLIKEEEIFKNIKLDQNH